MDNARFFYGSFATTIAGIIAALFVGGTEALFLVLVLSLLEVSLSFDNAVVNASVLAEMNAIWRKRFLTWGILIAVFGMRVVFPVVIVCIIASTNPLTALDIAINDPSRYASLLSSSHVSLMAFGGAFLLMVGLSFFFDSDKDHWVSILEVPMSLLGKLPFSSELFAVATLSAFSIFLIQDSDDFTFLLSGAAGVLTFSAVHCIASFMEKKESKRKGVTAAAAKSGASLFLYLEILDASFSFDGVIGAFAISTNIFIIAIGLGIGAMFVRSLTIMLVEKDTLSEYRFLEHGAFWAILALASIMLIKTFHHVPEVITGSVGAGLIIIAFVHSLAVRSAPAQESS